MVVVMVEESVSSLAIIHFSPYGIRPPAQRFILLRRFAVDPHGGACHGSNVSIELD
jgi:hypothetical protein